jgi:hypothetical protein
MLGKIGGPNPTGKALLLLPFHLEPEGTPTPLFEEVWGEEEQLT